MTGQAKTKLVALMAALVWTGAAWGSLGNLSVQSNLGEPFRGEISLGKMTDAELKDLSIGLASSDDFRRLGVEYNRLADNLRFTTGRRSNGQIYIRVSSSVPISEPALSFVAYANVAGDRSVRQYTVLLDPVGYKPAATRVSQVNANTNNSNRVEASTTTKAASATRPTQIKVGAKDTLASIARKVQPSGASQKQTMAAIFQSNPKAFIFGNPANIRKGVTLRIPSIANIRALSSTRAQAILAGYSSKVAASNKQPKQASEIETNTTTTAPTTAPTTAYKPSASNSAANAALTPEQKQRLAALEAQISEDEAQTKAANLRMQALEKQIQQLAKQKAAPSAAPIVVTPPVQQVAPPVEIAKPAPAPVEIAKPAPAPVVAKPEPAPAENLSSVEPVSSLDANVDTASEGAADASDSAQAPIQDVNVMNASSGAGEVNSPASVAYASAPQAKKPIVNGPPLEEPDLGVMGWIMKNLTTVGLGAVVLGLIALLVISRKRRTVAQAEGLEGLSTQEATAATALTAGGNTFLTGFGGATFGNGMDQAEVDPLAEAEVYMAYGRADEAEVILKNALTKDPSRNELRSKLLEVYAQNNDTANFEKYAKEIYASTDGRGAVWEKTAQMGRNIDPDNDFYQQVSDVQALKSQGKEKEDDSGFPSAAAVLGGAAVAGVAAYAVHEMTKDKDPEPAKDVEIDPFADLMGNDDLTAKGNEATEFNLPSEGEDLMGGFDPFADLNTPEVETPVAPAPAASNMMMDNNSIDFDFDTPSTAPVEPAVTMTDTAKDDNLLDFDFSVDDDNQVIIPESAPTVDAALDIGDDLGEFNFDLSPTDDNSSSTNVTDNTFEINTNTDSLSTQLDLAQVYMDMGDKEGAKELLQGLIAESSGDVQAKAQQMLASL